MNSTAAHVPGPVLMERRARLDELTWQLYRDVQDRLRTRPAYTYLLDQALLELELRRAWGEDCGVGDPRTSFAAALARLPHEPPAGPWLYRGAAQAGWLAVHLGRHTGTTPSLTGVDATVQGWLEDFPPISDVDLPRGVLGLGVYALQHPDPAARDRLLRGVWEVLQHRVERDPAGIFIRLAPDPARVRDGSAGCRIIGAAHGTAGLVSYLASLLRYAEQDGSSSWERQVSQMLQEALAWLLAQAVAAEPQDSPPWQGLFPHRVELPDPTTRPTWCSGDPGISLCLRVAHQVTGHLEAGQVADLIDDRVLARAQALDPEDSGDGMENWGLVDACLCHGAAGLLWYASHAGGGSAASTSGQALADRWEDWLLARREAGPLRYFGPAGMMRDPSFLEGDVGVALTLLARRSGGSPAWEDLLLARVVEAPGMP